MENTGFQKRVKLGQELHFNGPEGSIDVTILEILSEPRTVKLGVNDTSGHREYTLSQKRSNSPINVGGVLFNITNNQKGGNSTSIYVKPLKDYSQI